MQALEYVKEHPWTIAGIVAAGLVLYLVVSSSGSTSTATDTTAVNQDPSLQIAQLQLQGHAQDIQGQIAIAQLNAGTALSIETLKAQSGEYATQIGGEVQLAGIQAQRDIGVLTVTSQQLIAQSAQETNRVQIQATEDIALANAATYAHLADVNAATLIATQQIGANVAISGQRFGAATQQSAISAQRNASNNQLWGSIASIAGNVIGAIF